MGVISAEMYQALLLANVPEDKARAAAAEVAKGQDLVSKADLLEFGTQLRSEMDKRFAGIDKRFAGIDMRFAELEKSLAILKFAGFSGGSVVLALLFKLVFFPQGSIPVTRLLAVPPPSSPLSDIAPTKHGVWNQTKSVDSVPSSALSVDRPLTTPSPLVSSQSILSSKARSDVQPCMPSPGTRRGAIPSISSCANGSWPCRSSAPSGASWTISTTASHWARPAPWRADFSASFRMQEGTRS